MILMLHGYESLKRAYWYCILVQNTYIIYFEIIEIHTKQQQRIFFLIFFIFLLKLLAFKQKNEFIMSQIQEAINFHFD